MSSTFSRKIIAFLDWRQNANKLMVYFRVNNITVLHLDTALVYANAKGATSTFLNNVTATVGSVEVAGQFEFNNADLDGLILNGAGALR